MKPLQIALLTLAVPLVLSASIVDTVTIDVTEDGQDFLLFSGNTLEWEHISLFSNGGVAGGTQTETNVLGNSVSTNNPFIHVSGTTTGSGSNFTNSNWYNGTQGLSCSSGLTCPYFDTSHEFTLPTGYSLAGLVGNVTLTTLICQGASGTTVCGHSGNDPVPTITNIGGGVWRVNLDDGPAGGTHEFKIELTWDPPTVTPEPASMALSGIGLVGLGLAGWRRKRAQ